MSLVTSGSDLKVMVPCYSGNWDPLGCLQGSSLLKPRKDFKHMKPLAGDLRAMSRWMVFIIEPLWCRLFLHVRHNPDSALKELKLQLRYCPPPVPGHR